jgi:protein-L-isoaspartate O-methyltransferase
MVTPFGQGRNQRLRLFVRNGGAFQEKDLGECIFVPMVGGRKKEMGLGREKSKFREHNR